MTSTDLRTDPDLTEVVDAIRRYVASRIGAAQRDDVVQETVARLLEQRHRLDEGALLPYGLVTARNLLVSEARRHHVEERNRHRVLVDAEPERPEEAVVAAEEARSLRVALARLGADERAVLLAHELEGASTRELAAPRATSDGAIAVRLASTRAKLRVDYVLALRHATLPTSRCRGVLEALSAGDRRRQASLGAGAHLASCATCADLSEPLLQRRRGLAGWWPLPLALRLAKREVTTHPVVASVAGVGIAVGIGLATAGGSAAPPAPTPPATVVLDARPVRGTLPVPLPDAGPVEVRRGRILAVVADEGFWLAATDRQRVWVQLTGGGESPVRFRAGELVSFRGRLVHHGPGFAAAAGVTAAEGAPELDGLGAHLEVAAADVRVA